MSHSHSSTPNLFSFRKKKRKKQNKKQTNHTKNTTKK